MPISYNALVRTLDRHGNASRFVMCSGQPNSVSLRFSGNAQKAEQNKFLTPTYSPNRLNSSFFARDKSDRIYPAALNISGHGRVIDQSLDGQKTTLRFHHITLGGAEPSSWPKTEIVVFPEYPSFDPEDFVRKSISVEPASIDADTDFGGLLKGTLISTPRGEVAIEKLMPGDEVYTSRSGIATVRDVKFRRLLPVESLMAPWLRPVIIPKGAFGGGVPTKDLVVSPDMKIVLTGINVETLFGEDQVFCSARQLRIDASSTQYLTAPRFDYYQIVLDQQQAIWANGLEVETFLFSGKGQEKFDQTPFFEGVVGSPLKRAPNINLGTPYLRSLGDTEASVYWSSTRPLGYSG